MNPPVVAQNVAMTSNVPIPSISTTSLVPRYPSNADRFDLNVHFLLTYLCLKFFSDFKLTSVIMTPFQFLGAFAAVVCSSASIDAPAGPGTSFGSYGQCDAQYGAGSRYMSDE